MYVYIYTYIYIHIYINSLLRLGLLEAEVHKKISNYFLIVCFPKEMEDLAICIPQKGTFIPVQPKHMHRGTGLLEVSGKISTYH